MANATFLNALKGSSIFKIPRPVDYTDNVVSTTMDGDATFTLRTPQLLRLDPDGADRTITMYSAVGHNRWHIVYNGGVAGEDITITGVATLNAGEWCWFASDQTNWVVIGQAVGQTLQIDDDVALIFGSASGGDATISYVSASDDLLINQITATASTIIQLATDSSATDFQVQNNTGTAHLTIGGDGVIQVDGAGAVTVESTAGALSVGADAVAQAVNIGTGAAARVITIGNAASASLAMDGGVGAVSLQGDTTVDIDAGTALGVESAGGAISIGADAVAQALNLGTGAAARVITIGNAASASMGIDSGVGALTVQGDTTIDIDAGTALGIESAGGAISIGADAVAQAINIGTGAAARVITIGNASSASLALESGAGAGSWNSDTSITLAPTTSVIVSAPINQDYTATGATELAGCALVINHATANAIGVHGSVQQSVTNRTAGTAVGVLGSVTSLAGDTAGVDYYAFQATATTGEAGADHMGLHVDAGFDWSFDLSAVATGEGGVLLGDNLADAWSMSDSTGDLLVLGTATGAFTAGFAARMTTTDAVPSGTARVIGGRAYSNTAASAAISNTTTEALFDTTYTMPADTLKAGTQVRIAWQGIATATNGTDTLAIVLRIGGVAGTALTTLAATDVANSDIFSGEMVLICRTVGSGGTFVASGWSSDFTSASSEAVVREFVASTAIDTTVAQVIGVSADWGAAATGNSCRLDVLTVDIL